MPARAGNKIMHAAVRIGKTTLLASDGQCRGKPRFGGFALTLIVRTKPRRTAGSRRSPPAARCKRRWRKPSSRRASAWSPTTSAYCGWSASPSEGGTTMRFMMLMIPRVYQPDTPPGQRAGERFTPPAEAVARMTKFNERMRKAGALITLDGLQPSASARASFAGGKTEVAEGRRGGEGGGRRLLDDPGEIEGRGRRLGQALPGRRRQRHRGAPGSRAGGLPARGAEGRRAFQIARAQKAEEVRPVTIKGDCHDREESSGHSGRAAGPDAEGVGLPARRDADAGGGGRGVPRADEVSSPWTRICACASARSNPTRSRLGLAR